MKNIIGGVLLGVAISTPTGKQIVNQGSKIALTLGNQYLQSRGINLLQIEETRGSEDDKN